jgi:hypothetical protein
MSTTKPILPEDAAQYFIRPPTESELDAAVMAATNAAIRNSACKVSKWPAIVSFTAIMNGGSALVRDSMSGLDVYERILRLYSPTYLVGVVIKKSCITSVAYLFEEYKGGIQLGYAMLDLVFTPLEG